MSFKYNRFIYNNGMIPTPPSLCLYWNALRQQHHYPSCLHFPAHPPRSQAFILTLSFIIILHPFWLWLCGYKLLTYSIVLFQQFYWHLYYHQLTDGQTDRRTYKGAKYGKLWKIAGWSSPEQNNNPPLSEEANGKTKRKCW